MQQLGRYEILEELGRGAMGAVYKARDPQIGRIVAIKVILTANLTPDDFQHYKERFKREAQAAGQMSHPGIITIHDIAEDENGQPFIVMEFVEGRTLEKMLEGGSEGNQDSTDPGIELPKAPPRLLVGTALDIGIQLAEAMDYAHKRNIIHRDIKPANILITADGRAKVLDFGIAKLPGSQMTQTGMMMGTPAFMSPEQVSASPIDHRSDIFSLGGVLYWMFTGEKPFPGESLTSITFKIAFAQPLPANYLNRALPPEIDIVLSRCLAKNVGDRYASAQDLADDLRAIKENRPIKATRLPVADSTAMQQTAGLQVPATPLPAQAQQSQAGAPPGETSAPAGAPSAAAAASPAAPAAATAAAPSPARKSNALIAVLAIVGLGAALLAGYLLWQKPTETQTQATQTAAPAPAQAPAETPESKAQPADSGTETPARKTSAQPGAPAPASITSSSSAAKTASEKAQPARSAAMSQLVIEVNHNFKQADLVISAGTKEIYRAELDEKNKTLRAAVEISATAHLLKVRVISERDKFDQEKEQDGIFREGHFRKLTIDFGRGSGLGFTKRELRLRLGESTPLTK